LHNKKNYASSRKIWGKIAFLLFNVFKNSTRLPIVV
jgi:hypothetical protein